jgi:hypothetical protein
MLDVSKAVDEATKITLKYRYIDLLLRDWTEPWKPYIYFRSSYWNSFVWEYCEGHFVTIQDFDKQLIAVGKTNISGEDLKQFGRSSWTGEINGISIDGLLRSAEVGTLGVKRNRYFEILPPLKN